MCLTQHTIWKCDFLCLWTILKWKGEIEYTHFISWIWTKTRFLDYDVSCERQALLKYVQNWYENINVHAIFFSVLLYTAFYLKPLNSLMNR